MNRSRHERKQFVWSKWCIASFSEDGIVQHAQSRNLKRLNLEPSLHRQTLMKAWSRHHRLTICSVLDLVTGKLCHAHLCVQSNTEYSVCTKGRFCRLTVAISKVASFCVPITTQWDTTIYWLSHSNCNSWKSVIWWNKDSPTDPLNDFLSVSQMQMAMLISNNLKKSDSHCCYILETF